jgi:hypothetical protein
MYFYPLWSSGCLLSLPVVMGVLGPVLSCCCYAVPGMTDSILSFFPVLLQRVGGLYSYVCCSVINFPDRWYSCIYFCSQQFMWLPFLHCFSSFNVVSAGPNSCLFCIIWFAYADCGLQFLFGWCAPYILSVCLCRIVLRISCYMWYILCCIFHSDYLVSLVFRLIV